MIKGFDTAARLTHEQAVQLRNLGYEYAIRYCVPSGYSKALTKAEADAILDAGLTLGLCWETTASRAKNGAAAGLADGRSAKACAEALGAPDETIIWFAVDYEAPKADLDRIAGYMVAAGVSCRPYKLGIYGPYHVIEELAWREIGSAYWQCVGWSGGKWSACVDVQQREWNVKTGIVTVDNDYAKDITGMWRRETIPMFYKFTPAEMGIYLNRNKRTIEQIKKELNADIVCNLNLFNRDWSGACYTRADGAVVGSDGYGYFGFAFDRNDKVLQRAWSAVDNHANFFGCWDLIVSGEVTTNETPSWTSGYRRRTVIGMCADGKIFIYCNTQVETVSALADFLVAHGATEAIVLDGGGSTQAITPEGVVVSSDPTPRRVHTLFWANLTRKPVPCPFAEPTVNVRWGSFGNAAKWVQWQLNRKGRYGLAVDGIFLSKSVTALKDFQRKQNLVVDGICGKNTRGILAK